MILYAVLSFDRPRKRVALRSTSRGTERGSGPGKMIPRRKVGLMYQMAARFLVPYLNESSWPVTIKECNVGVRIQAARVRFSNVNRAIYMQFRASGEISTNKRLRYAI